MTISIGDQIMSPDYAHVGIVTADLTARAHFVLFSDGVFAVLDDDVAEQYKVTFVEPPMGEPEPNTVVNSNFWTSNQLYSSVSSPGFPENGWCANESGQRKNLTVAEYFTVPVAPGLVLCLMYTIDASNISVVAVAGAQQAAT